MKKGIFTISSKAILLCIVLVCSLVVATIAADILLYDSLEYYSCSIISLLFGAVVAVLFTFLTRLHAASLAHASLTEIIRVAIISTALLVTLAIVSFIQDETTLPWVIIVSGIFFGFA